MSVRRVIYLQRKFSILLNRQILSHNNRRTFLNGLKSQSLPYNSGPIFAESDEDDLLHMRSIREIEPMGNRSAATLDSGCIVICAPIYTSISLAPHLSQQPGANNIGLVLLSVSSLLAGAAALGCELGRAGHLLESDGRVVRILEPEIRSAIRCSTVKGGGSGVISKA